jgi:hypothetical protein
MSEVVADYGELPVELRLLALGLPPPRVEYVWYPFVPREAPTPGPFTVDKLRGIIGRVAKRYQLFPESDSELKALANLLNTYHRAHQARGVVRANQRRAAEVRYALHILASFFDERRQACEEPGVDQQTRENERRLRHQFDSLVEMLAATPLALDMDVGVMAPPLAEGWRSYGVHLIAQAFRLIVEKANPDLEPLRYSNTGPVARFTTEVLEVITGEKLYVYTVGQHLRQPYQRKKSPKPLLDRK